MKFEEALERQFDEVGEFYGGDGYGVGTHPEHAKKRIKEAHNAEVVSILEGLKPTAYPDPLGGVAEWEMWGKHYIKQLSEAIKKHGGENESH